MNICDSLIILAVNITDEFNDQVVSEARRHFVLAFAFVILSSFFN